MSEETAKEIQDNLRVLREHQAEEDGVKSEETIADDKEPTPTFPDTRKNPRYVEGAYQYFLKQTEQNELKMPLLTLRKQRRAFYFAMEQCVGFLMESAPKMTETQYTQYITDMAEELRTYNAGLEIPS